MTTDILVMPWMFWNFDLKKDQNFAMKEKRTQQNFVKPVEPVQWRIHDFPERVPT